MSRNSLRRRTAILGGVSLALFLSACGSSSPSSATGSTASASAVSASGIAAAKQLVNQYENPATSIGITSPLTGAPPKNKVVAWLAGNLSDISTITTGFKQATSALGWKLLVIPYDITNLTSISAAMTQAVEQGANYIAISGEPTTTWGTAYAMVKSKKIPVFESFTADTAEGASNDVYVNIGGNQFEDLLGKLVSAYNTVYWKGHPNILYVTDESYPVLDQLQQASQSALKQFCPSCQFNVLNISNTQLAQGTTPQQVVSYIESHRDVNTIQFAFGEMSTGTASALKSAGLDKNLIIDGSDPQQPNLTSLSSGAEQMWVGEPTTLSAFYQVDAMARLALGMGVSPELSGLMPTQIITAQNVAHPAPSVYVPFSNAVQQFEQLWKVPVSG